MSLCSPTSSEDYTFQVLDNTHTRWGQQLFAESGGSIRPGILVQFADSSGSNTKPTIGSERPIGIAYGSRHSVYRPMTQCYAAAEPHVALTGRGHAVLGASLFTAGSAPSTLNTKLYAGINGRWATSGTYPVGRYLGPYYHWTGAGVQVQTTLAHVEFVIPAFTNP